MNMSAGKRTRRICIGTIGLGIAFGIGAAITPPTAEADASVGRPSQTRVALDALTVPGPESTSAAMPAGFTQRFYAPTIEDGLLVDPDGDCSSPIPLPSEFDIPCKAHDLGYDLIRFGGDGQATAEARRDLDTRLGTRMHDSCVHQPDVLSRSSCNVMAEIAVTAVRFNSWRQNYGVPVPEPELPYLLAGSIGVVAVTVAAVAVPLRTRVAKIEVPV